MKKSSVLFCVAAIILLLMCGCSLSQSDKEDPVVSAKNQYIDTINQKLVSFSDCANDFSGCLEQISNSTTIPTSTQIADIESSMGRLSSVCSQIQEVSAPDDYLEAQTALNEAMKKYEAALEKCQALLNFYKEYDTNIHSYSTPEEGGTQMEQQAKSLYAEFAEAMQQAASSFRTAQAELI